MVHEIEIFKYKLILLIAKMEEQSAFTGYFGDYPLIRVLDFLILGRDMDYSMTEIAKNSEVGWTAFSDIWPKLVEKNIVVFTRKIGNAQLYRLNLKNLWVKELIKMDQIITKMETEKMLSQEKLVG